MTPQEKLEQAADDYVFSRDGSQIHEQDTYIAGGLKGMEIQKEIDAPKFKTLEAIGWKSYDRNTWLEIKTCFGDYAVFSDNTYAVPDKNECLPCDNLDHGKQLAQKDYEEKCKSLLK